MNRTFVLVVVLLFLSIVPFPIESFHSENQKMPDFAPGELIVKFKEGKGPSIPSEVSGKIQEMRAMRIQFVESLPIRTNGRIYKVKIDENSDIISAAKELMKNPDIEYAEPNYVLRTFEIPNDPNFTQQWSLNKTNASLGWDITTGNSSVIIAIIDTGVDWDHPDLAANIWNNTGETPDNSVDDDANNYTDDVRGWDFVDDTSGTPYTCTDNDCDTADNNPMDFNGHGTHCAGIAGAVTNNSLGVAGVCRNCTIMPLRAGWDCDSGSGCILTSDAAEAVTYAANNGAKVISMSFGYNASTQTLKNAVDYAYGKGAVIVASSGNTNEATLYYPAAHENVIAVSATKNNDARADYSNYGYWTDVSAPGGYGTGASQMIYSTLYDDTYGNSQGTSMACPFVAGLAGLILSKNSTYNPLEVETIILSSTDPLTSSYYIGTGRVNILKALERNVTPLIKFGTDLENQTVNGTININGTANGTAFVNYTIYYGSGFYPSSWYQINYSNISISNSTLASWDTRYVQNGTYTLRILAYDSENSTSEDRLILHTQNSPYILNISSCSNLNIANVIYNLTSNVTANGTCMNINADNVTLECNGFTINYSTSEMGFGVNNSGDDNVTIRNCEIIRGNGNYGIAEIALVESENGNIANNSIKGMYGILITSSSHNNVTNNTIHTNETNGHGISLYSGSLYNNIINNTISTNGSQACGIYVSDNSNHNDIYNNSVSTAGDYGHGLHISSISNYNTIYSNIVSTQGEQAYGIYIHLNSTYNNATGNSIVTKGISGFGILLENNADYNGILNNSIVTNESSGRGIFTYNTSKNNITNNSIFTNGTLGTGIYLVDTSNSTLLNNFVYTNGTFSYGLYFSYDSDNNILANSSIVSKNSDALYFSKSTEKPENNSIYNNLFNGSIIPVNFSEGYDGINYWNTSNQTGNRTWSNGTNIGGNYYTNSTGNFFSDVCNDANEDGFCDLALNISTMTSCTPGLDCGNNTDYLAYSNAFNWPPVVENVTLNCSDSLNRTNGTLNGYFNFTDIDNLTEHLTNATKWFKNGIEQVGFENQTVIPEANTTKNDVWIFSAGAFDGYAWTWVNSTPITIANTPPSAPELLSPVIEANISNSTVSFTWNSSTDMDNDTISYIFYAISSDTNYEELTVNNYTSFSMADGFYNWTVTANDGDILIESSAGNFTKDSTSPTINSATSHVIANNFTNISLAANFTDAHPGSMWLNITLPTAETVLIPISNNTPVDFQINNTGDYTATFYANDTFGNNASSVRSIHAENPMNFTVNVVGYNLAGLSANVTILYNNTQVTRNSTSGGYANSTIPNYTYYEVKFEALSNNLSVLLRSINASRNTNKTMGFDKTSSADYFAIYAVNNTYLFSTADVNMSYGTGGYLNENYFGFYRCSSWNFQSRTCSVSWENITSSVTQNTATDSILLTTNSFSAFAIKQELYCGNGVCDNSETCSSCSVDCGTCPPSGSTIVTGSATTTTTTVEDEIVIIRTTTTVDETTTTIFEAYSTTTTTIPPASSNPPTGQGTDLSVVAIALAIPLIAGVAFWMIKTRKIQEMMESMLMSKSYLFKELILLEKEAIVAKNDGHQTERIDDELVLAKRAIESGALGSAKSHMDNARSLISLYKKTR